MSKSLVIPLHIFVTDSPPKNLGIFLRRALTWKISTIKALIIFCTKSFPIESTSFIDDVNDYLSVNAIVFDTEKNSNGRNPIISRN